MYILKEKMEFLLNINDSYYSFYLNLSWFYFSDAYLIIKM